MATTPKKSPRPKAAPRSQRPKANPKRAASGSGTANSKMEKAIGKYPYTNTSDGKGGALGSSREMRAAQTGGSREGAEARKKLRKTAQQTRKGK
jgi:hypothetical protein